MRWRLAVFMAVFSLSMTEAWACTVCGPGEDESVFTLSTLLLTFLPLLMLAGVVRYAQKKWEAQEAERLRFEESQDPRS